MKCPRCDAEFACCASRANRAEAIGAPLYCGRVCAGLARRLVNPPSVAERKAAKQAYDAVRRAEKHDEICRKKREHYYANRARILIEQTAYRAAHMQRHVEYCRQPAYREWKATYDARYRARTEFGEFAEAFLLLQDVEREIAARATRYDIYMTNGTINKAQSRRRSL